MTQGGAKAVWVHDHHLREVMRPDHDGMVRTCAMASTKAQPNFTTLVVFSEYEALKGDRDRLRELLSRIRWWDHLNATADGKFWREEIDSALNAKR